jgi:hypothetical protein
MTSNARATEVGKSRLGFNFGAKPFIGSGGDRVVRRTILLALFFATGISVAASASPKKQSKPPFDPNEVVLKGLPEYSEPYQPIIEFRARGGFPGHAFMLFGRKLNDGTTIFYGGAGYYPKGEPGTVEWFKNIIYGAGLVSYRFDDAANGTPIVFRVNITRQQEIGVLQDVASFGNRYSLVSQNCVLLMDIVAKDIGLRSGLRGQLLDQLSVSKRFPVNYVSSLRAENNADTPLRYEEQQRRELAKLDAAARAKADAKRDQQIPQQPIPNRPPRTEYGPGPGGGHPYDGSTPPRTFPGPITETKPPRMTPMKPPGPVPGPRNPYAGSNRKSSDTDPKPRPSGVALPPPR